jgi:hypothetical protein
MASPTCAEVWRSMKDQDKNLRNAVIAFAIIEALILIPIILYIIFR